jgi:hypothetical protein
MDAHVIHQSSTEESNLVRGIDREGRWSTWDPRCTRWSKRRA